MLNKTIVINALPSPSIFKVCNELHSECSFAILKITMPEMNSRLAQDWNSSPPCYWCVDTQIESRIVSLVADLQLLMTNCQTVSHHVVANHSLPMTNICVAGHNVQTVPFIHIHQ